MGSKAPQPNPNKGGTPVTSPPPPRKQFPVARRVITINRDYSPPIPREEFQQITDKIGDALIVLVIVAAGIMLLWGVCKAVF